MAPDAAARAKVTMLRAHEDEATTGGEPADVPDPYYGGSRGFEDVFDICQAACAGFLARLRREHRL
jgi:protein-tyrosine phosphatase